MALKRLFGSHPTAVSPKQSPINIIGHKGGLHNHLYGSAPPRSTSKRMPLNFQGAYANGAGGRVRGGVVENDGYCVRYVLPDGEKATITGGALDHKDVFQLHSFHVHFGSEDWHGSEHTVDGQAYSAEIQFVHYNAKYGDFNSAKSQRDGLAVIGVFVKLGTANPEFDELKFGSLYEKGARRKPFAVFLNNVLPPIRNYYYYEGSLTTPPYSENVRWIIMQHPIEISTSQMWGLRRIHNEEKKPMENNYRETQSLNERQVQFLFE